MNTRAPHVIDTALQLPVLSAGQCQGHSDRADGDEDLRKIVTAAAATLTVEMVLI